MKIIYNNIIPFKGFVAINLFGVLFARKEYKNYLTDSVGLNHIINHESIHTAQMKELLYVGFYIWYFIEWLVQLIINIKNPSIAYYCIRFEREAYAHQHDSNYLKNRKHYNWLKL